MTADAAAEESNAYQSLFNVCIGMWGGKSWHGVQESVVLGHFFVASSHDVTHAAIAHSSLCAASVTAPSATNLRILAKEGKLLEEDAKIVLTLPVLYQNVVDVFLKNKNLLLKEFSTDKGIPFHIAVLSNLDKYIPLDEQELVIFDDEHRDSELVYGIAVNR